VGGAHKRVGGVRRRRKPKDYAALVNEHEAEDEVEVEEEWSQVVNCENFDFEEGGGGVFALGSETPENISGEEDRYKGRERGGMGGNQRALREGGCWRPRGSVVVCTAQCF